MFASKLKLPKTSLSTILPGATLAAFLALGSQPIAAQGVATLVPQAAPAVLVQVGPNKFQLVSNVDGLEIFLGGSDSIGGGSLGPGEVQSTLVPPGKKDQCPGGQLLISNDDQKSPGLVYRFDLDNFGAPAGSATPEGLPDPSVENIAANDHDLVTLNNGDVLLLKMGRSIADLEDKPDWFDYAYKIISSWGPGARSVLYIWRSEDCGQSFSLRSSIDTATMNDGYGTADDGWGGTPQWPMSTQPPGSQNQPIWNMGGTDGPLAMVDRKTERIFYAIGVEGNKRDTSKRGYHLQPTGGSEEDGKINRTTVALSTDRGDNWSDAITLPFRGWRTEVVPMNNNRVAFLPWSAWSCGVGECWRIHVKNLSGPGVDPGIDFYIPLINRWTDISNESGNESGPARIDVDGTDVFVSRMFKQPVLARSPDSTGLILAVPEMIANGGGYGYGLYFVDGEGNYTPMKKIAPVIANGKGVIFHLAVVDLGVGPVLVYWYDVNAINQKVQVRGRLITGDSAYSSDFPVSLQFEADPTSTWYGDYQMAGGFVRNLQQITQTGVPSPTSSNPPTFEYFPVWKQPDDRIHFSHIIYKKPTPLAVGHHLLLENARLKIPFDPPGPLQLPYDKYERKEN